MNPVMLNPNHARRWTTALAACIFVVGTAIALPASAANWITSWAASPQGPYPSGAAVAQPDLSFAFPDNAANDQTFRLIVRPNIWLSRFVRIHFTNLFGNQPITLDGAFIGIQKTGAEIVATTEPARYLQWRFDEAYSAAWRKRLE